MHEWRVIPGHPNYRISSAGEVYSIRSDKILKPWLSNAGYPVVGLDGGKRWLVHRLVALSFHGPCPDGLEVRHLDGDRRNPQASNLAYGTRSENGLDKRLHGTNPGPRSVCINGHAKDGGRCLTCFERSKRAWVDKNVGVYVVCDQCGKSISKLNVTGHQKREICRRAAA